VWGNVDGWELRGRIPEIARLELGGVPVVMLHGMQLGSPTPEKAAASYGGAGLIVFGHSHKPVIRQVGATLAVNPGSAGPVRFRDPVTVALAELEEGRAAAWLVELDPKRK
ncbi:MAG: metallophosphoesterase family protein, partial [Gemmatimonadetes bacterium]|nr:metallophosphoesterase family protein [Gemmatimonadota bacterium]